MAKGRDYRRLDPDKLVETIEALKERIQAKMGERGLTNICGELASVASDAKHRTQRLKRPFWLLRLIPVLATGAIVYITWAMHASISVVDASVGKMLTKELQDLLFAVRQLLSSAALPIALAVPVPLVFAMFVFIWTIEARWKRHRTLRYLHELRSLVHVIDMHQLTKDPHVLADGSDPDRLSGEMLMRYLDYCSELLSMSAKVATLYAESSHDAVVIEAVSDLVQTTSNLSSKIWQKLTIIERQGQIAA
jgi:hypothetical protein